MRSATLLALVFLVGTFGCSSKEKEIKRIMESPISYQSHVSPDADFTSYGTWDWLPIPMGITDPRAGDPQLRKVLEDVVGKQMDVRGYKRNTQSPDIVVNYHVASETIDKDYMEKMYDGSYLPEYRLDYKGPRSARKRWEEGSLLVFIFDNETRQMIWQGSATAEITDEAPEQDRVERLNKVAKTMFTSLPARPRYGAQ